MRMTAIPTASALSVSIMMRPIALRRGRLKETRGLALVAGAGQAALPESRVAYCRIDRCFARRTGVDDFYHVVPVFGDDTHLGLLKNEGLARMVVGEIPQVFRGEGHLVDLVPSGMGTRDDVLFYSSHDGFSASSCNC